MCLTIPAQVVEIKKNKAVIKQSNGNQQIDISLIPSVRIGNWILYTGDFAVKKIDSKEASEIMELLRSHQSVDTTKLRPRFKTILQAVSKRDLTKKEIEYLLRTKDQIHLQALYSEADTIRKSYIRDHICIHGIIEFSNYCVNNCLYCGLRRENIKNKYYRMTPQEIIKVADQAVNLLGYKMLVLQSGDDYWYDDKKLVEIVEGIKKRCRVFIYLSVGDRAFETYKKLKQAGADGVLYRFETSNSKLYAKLHPQKTLKDRLDHLKFMKKLGYVISSGSIVGLPGQTISDLANDILLMKKLKVFMPSMGPFIPADNTPFAKKSHGGFGMSLKMIAVTRLLLKKSRIPITTALETIGPKDARKQAFKAGANSIMFNLTPAKYRKNYKIYKNKFYDEKRKIEKWGLFKGEASYKMLEKELKVKI